VLITPWGGLLPSRYAVVEMPGGIEQSRWVTDPFAFLQAALALPPLPAPDTTTETGRRLFFAHIDGDGFPSRAELPGLPLGAEVLLTEVLTRYKLPHAMSVIEAEVAPHGLYPREAPAMEAAARRIFALPNVEIATHTYTHPFFWAEVDKGRPSTAAQGYTLAPPGYTPNLEREIIGSTEYIRQRLAPAGKPVRLLLWSGNAAPTLRALEIAEGAGLLTMNGGNTIASRTYPSLTAVGPLGIRLGEHFQAYAPIMNENVFTNLWTGPFYGFERVIETFRFTGSPRRIKPIDIYYHTYSATKRASLNALHKVYSWALAQPIHPVFPSEFVEKANNFNTLVLARPIDRDAILVRNATHLRTLRVPPQLGLPNLATGNGVAGWLKGEEGYYLHLAGSTAELRLTPRPRRCPCSPRPTPGWPAGRAAAAPSASAWPGTRPSNSTSPTWPAAPSAWPAAPGPHRQRQAPHPLPNLPCGSGLRSSMPSAIARARAFLPPRPDPVHGRGGGRLRPDGAQPDPRAPRHRIPAR
jgi:hypothetical protein